MKSLLTVLESVNREITSFPENMTVSDEKFPEYQELLELRKSVMKTLIDKQFSMRKGTQEEIEEFGMYLLSLGLKPHENRPKVSEDRLNMLYEIFAAWEQFPSQRLGQLLINAIPEGSDLFYKEDSHLVENLKGYMEEHKEE